MKKQAIPYMVNTSQRSISALNFDQPTLEATTRGILQRLYVLAPEIRNDQAVGLIGRAMMF